MHSLGAMTGNQAMQMARAGLEAIYLSGWQVAADSNVAGAMYPDQSLYPANSGPELCRRINRTFQRADQIEHAEGGAQRDWFLPIVADAEAGFGGPLNTFEIMKAYIEAGAAGVHFEDQLASEKKCGHLGGKVLIPTAAHERNLIAARLAADVMGTSTLIMARTDAESAKLITSDVDERDRPFIEPDSRTPEGFYRLKDGTGLDHCIARGLAYAELADLLWWETSHPDLDDARKFAEAVHKRYPGKLLAYNCSPSFNWKKKLDDATIAKFQRELGAMGYKFQFVTLAGFHQLNYGMFDLASGYRDRGMGAYSELQVGRVRGGGRAAIPPPATSARSAPAISIRSRWSSPAASPPPPPWRNRPRPPSSTPPPSFRRPSEPQPTSNPLHQRRAIMTIHVSGLSAASTPPATATPSSKAPSGWSAPSRTATRPSAPGAPSRRITGPRPRSASPSPRSLRRP